MERIEDTLTTACEPFFTAAERAYGQPRELAQAILARLDQIGLRIVPVELVMQEITNESQGLGIE
jgi:hypothetical protein